MKNTIRKVCALAFAFAFLCSCPVGASAEATPVISGDVEISSRFLELFREEEKSVERLSLIPGGGVFGIRISTGGVFVDAVTSEDLSSKIAPGDKIVRVDNTEITSVKELMSAVSKASDAVTLTIERGDKTFAVQAKIESSDHVKKLGLTVKDTVSGIGTVSFVDPETGRFAGLGHGISTGEGMGLVPVDKADVTGVILGGVAKGECGKPGELHGVLKNNAVGKAFVNDECGVFGTLDEIPKEQALPVADRHEVHAGDAKIICTVKNGERAEYAVTLSEIDENSHGTKSFTVTVTDPALIAQTGGIVRGMSGSPIIQDGKIVGALTHVTVADPKRGFGIFAVNMLRVMNCAEMQAA